MLAKLILSGIIIISSGIIGYILGNRYVQRLRDLKNLYISLQMLETEIMYSSNNLPRALKKVGKKSNITIQNFFLDTYDVLKDKKGLSVEEAWLNAIETNITKTSLNEEDKEILVDFGINLGNTDKENQIKNFQLAYLQLNKRQEHAETLRFKNERMYKKLGVLIGIAIVIVFI